MTASVNYAGRSVDLLIFQGVQPVGEARINLGLGAAGSICTGVQKAVQTFVLLFLTDKGSVAGEEARGTDFLQGLRTGFIHDDASLESAFRFAVMDVLNYDSENRPEETPDDEALEDVELVSYDLQPGYLNLTCRVVTLAGESREVIIPIPTVIK